MSAVIPAPEEGSYPAIESTTARGCRIREAMEEVASSLLRVEPQEQQPELIIIKQSSSRPATGWVSITGYWSSLFARFIPARRRNVCLACFPAAVPATLGRRHADHIRHSRGRRSSGS